MITSAPRNKMVGRKLTKEEIEELKAKGYIVRDIILSPNIDKPSATPQQIANRPGVWEDR